MENKEVLLSICITSYKRTKELLRCLNSIDILENYKVEVIVSEDNSPAKYEIEKIVKSFAENKKYKVIFNTNIKNLGYDRNLKKLIELSSGKYVLFMSDDDSFIPNALNSIYQFLDNENKEIILTPFYEGEKAKRNYNSNFSIEKGVCSASKYLYDGILFSGLIFKRECIKDISAEKFVNLNYFQIYLVLYCLYFYGGYYLNIPLIQCIGDGENAYGTTNLSGENQYLKNRDSVFSNLEFHKGLIKVIKIFDDENKTNILDSFENEYSLRSYGGLSRAREEGLKIYNDYWYKLNSLDIKLNKKVSVYYYLLLFGGSKIANLIVAFPKYMLLFLRKKKLI